MVIFLVASLEMKYSCTNHLNHLLELLVQTGHGILISVVFMLYVRFIKLVLDYILPYATGALYFGYIENSDDLIGNSDIFFCLIIL